MSQTWKNYIMVAIALPAMLGFVALGEKFLGTSETPGTIPGSISTKPETETVKLRIRSKGDKEPIQDVSVEFAVSNGSSSTKPTDSGGYTDIEIPKGVDIEIFLRHKEYAPENYRINSDIERGKVKEFYLKRKPKVSSSSISTPSEPEPTISGVWIGKYACKQGITGVNVTITQTGDEVKAIFSFYPVPENPNIPSGKAEYKGNFYSTSREIIFPQGTWIDRPAINWTAYGFNGQFDENLETFSGKMDHYSCRTRTINLTRKDS
ncbi:hypothetical protein [Nostoc sp. TCL240-02]|uniref:hypothetical protein n=1 Tax=Nostoc sp. TCL240-02 TaxID=2572090 RepID=UPI00157F96A4|nr:hypothetical protein [Nostoc sp. TCL240-02]QKQ74207.1 hypothetical protein FBB35_13530 [Nostoc sp. TCL240-02]